jgi:hypothetical protein
MEIEELFFLKCNEADNTRIMMDEAMVSKHTLPLLLHAQCKM